ncbi:MAG TPA: prepilin-type N-terminal cleavage/methylation domain-containing protein [Myxococcaceae bacterium]|nr:prepilin-type N-terminal cleavage/methylation domain-containing protein [Myxococcaceae bacterium]
MRRAFTLLEVVVALAILALSLMAIFSLNSGAVASHAYAKRITVATMLARSKMTDIEQELYDKGFDADDREIEGDFRAEGWEAYTWKAQILTPRTTEISPDKLLETLFNLPPGKDGASGLAALLGGGRDGGVSSALNSLSGSGGLQQLAQSYTSQAGPSLGALPPGATAASGLSALGPFAALAQTQMQQLLTQIQQSVREVHLTVSWKDGKRTESIDFINDVFSMRQGSDRNGTPGAALSSASGVPGAPGVPGVPGVPAVQGPPGQFPGFNTGGQSIFSGPIRGNTPPGTPVDPQGRPIRQ